MNASWKITARGSKPSIQGALLAHESALDWDMEIILSGCEEAPDRPDDWVLEAWLSRRPSRADKASVAALFAESAPALEVAKLPDADWVTISQQGIEPIHAGKFCVRTPEFPPPEDPAIRDFIIPASQAFGTGQHETTSGCLTMLTAMKRSGMVVRRCADIGTGTGLLAFAALDLWPRTQATTTDIDPVCVDVVEYNAAENGFAMGAGAGDLTMIVADGMDNELLQARAPYDLLIANILARPLIELAPDFASNVAARGSILLAGLLVEQEPEVRRAYSRAGFRLAQRLVQGDWVILWMRKRQFA